MRYVKEREAFGKPLARLQRVRFEIAEIATETAVTQTLLDRSVTEHSQRRLDAVHASMAKWWAHRAAEADRRPLPATPRRLRLHE